MIQIFSYLLIALQSLACPILDGDYRCTSPETQGSYEETIVTQEIEGGRLYQITMDYMDEVFEQIIHADGKMKAEPHGTSLAKCMGNQVIFESESGEYDENDQKIAVIHEKASFTQLETEMGYVYRGATQFSFSDGHSMKYDSHWVCQKR